MAQRCPNAADHEVALVETLIDSFRCLVCGVEYDQDGKVIKVANRWTTRVPPVAEREAKETVAAAKKQRKN